jgi:hypothetical protein
VSAEHFDAFRRNLAVRNEGDIATSYAEITKRLNKDFWALESDITHRLQVGSYGRRTAVHGISDLDMVFELPSTVFDRVSKVKGNGPSQLLQEVRASLLARYPRTDIKADGQVVVVSFVGYVVEVLPAFLTQDGDYRFGDTHDDGTWKICKPRKEMAAVDQLNTRSNRNLKRVCKMLRAWKNEHGVPMSGMLIDTLTYRFFGANTSYDALSYGSYPSLLAEVFAHLKDQPEAEYWLAPGSGQRVESQGNFQRKAKRAHELCEEALATDSLRKRELRWREVFGSAFPWLFAEKVASASYDNTEEFIEKQYPVDVRYSLRIDAEVTSDADRSSLMLRLLHSFLPVGRKLRFFVDQCNVPEPYTVVWKVRNVGAEAERRNSIRGQLLDDDGNRERVERTQFMGPHYVECYAVKDGVCVARDRISVPIH